MTLGEVRAEVTARLNRRDCTAAMVDTFIHSGFVRIQRVIRTPSMERAHYINADPTSVESFLVPSDLLQIMDVFSNGLPIPKESFRGLMRLRALNPGAAGSPEYYARIGSSIFLFPPNPPLGEIVLTYFGQFSPLVGDSDSNEATAVLSDLVVFAALSDAGSHFKHDKAGEWEARFKSLATEIQDFAAQLEMTGGGVAVHPSHEDF